MNNLKKAMCTCLAVLTLSACPVVVSDNYSFINNSTSITASAYQTMSKNFAGGYKLTGNQAKDMVTIAQKQLGKTGSKLGYSEHWCADFVCDVARLTKMKTSVIPYTTYSSCNCVQLYKSLTTKYNAKAVTTPKVGDIVFFDWDGGKNANGLDHVAIVSYVSGNNIKYIGGNQGSSSSLYNRKVTEVSTTKSNKYIAKFVRPKYSTAKTTNNTVTIRYNANGGTIAKNGKYYIGSNSNIYTSSDKKLVAPVWKDGYQDKDGLFNASTFNLSRKGYTFLGWSLKKDSGTIYNQNDNTVSANDLLPTINKKSGTVTLYARWQKNSTTKSYTIKSSSGVKVRSGAGTSYGCIGGLAKGSVVKYTETKKANGYTWIKIKSVTTKSGSWGKYTGWVAMV